MSHKIIVIDDDEAMGVELAILLKSENFSVDVFTDPLKGLEKLLSDHYALLLLDITMPKLSGFDILKKVKEKGVKTRIIVITGNPIVKQSSGQDFLEGSTTREALSQADAVLNKPIDPVLLLAEINKLLNK